MNKVIYFNGTILSMNENNDVYEAICIEDGKIKAVGSYKELVEKEGVDAKQVDLGGNTMMPGFIDAHSHLTSYAQTLRLVNLTGCRSFDDMKQAIKKHIEKNTLPAGEWVTGFNYDHEVFKEKQHPTKDILDEISTTHQIVLSHISGHMGAMNSLALKEIGITSESVNPEGGVICRVAGSNEPNGVLLENAYIRNVFRVPVPTIEKLSELVVKAQNDYLSYGITTCQDGFTRKEEFKLLEYTVNSGKLLMDVVSYVDIKGNREIYSQNKDKYANGYVNHYKIGGYKVFLDGSPQGRTAWMETPYLGGEETYGISTTTNEEIYEFAGIALEDNAQLLAHCNGDAAANQLITAYEKALTDRGQAFTDTKPVMVHAQLVRADQLDRMKKIGMMPSFFTAHTFYWGDIHIKNFGFERASKISPSKTALDKGILFTYHQDTPVINPNMIETVWCAVNRISKEGVLLGEEERIPTLEALKAVTINCAKQYFEEDIKGSLEVGKLADMVILDENPLAVDKMKIRDIKVLETIKEGKVLYKTIKL